MRKIIIILCALMVCIGIAAQSVAGETYDLNGEWDAVYDNVSLGVSKDIVKISQEGNKFVGIKLIGNIYIPKGEKTIKGNMINKMIDQVSTQSVKGGSTELMWNDSRGVIIEDGNKIVIQAFINNWYVMTLTLTRKK
jgi:hypothetical protein